MYIVNTCFIETAYKKYFMFYVNIYVKQLKQRTVKYNVSTSKPLEIKLLNLYQTWGSLTCPEVISRLECRVQRVECTVPLQCSQTFFLFLVMK